METDSVLWVNPGRRSIAVVTSAVKVEIVMIPKSEVRVSPGLCRIAVHGPYDTSVLLATMRT